MNELWFFLHFPYMFLAFLPHSGSHTFALEDAKHRSQVATAHLRSSQVARQWGFIGIINMYYIPLKLYVL